jgi:hypothetical protein
MLAALMLATILLLLLLGGVLGTRSAPVPEPVSEASVTLTDTIPLPGLDDCTRIRLRLLAIACCNECSRRSRLRLLAIACQLVVPQANQRLAGR